MRAGLFPVPAVVRPAVQKAVGAAFDQFQIAQRRFREPGIAFPQGVEKRLASV